MIEGKKVNVYIDWFNFYYALKEKIEDINSQWETRYKWCNYRKLFANFLSEWETINTVYFFSAYRIGDNWAKKRHKVYTEALTKFGVKTILGNYQNKTNKYSKEKHTIECIEYNWNDKHKELCMENLIRLHYKTYEEKETDVKIAIQILEDAFLNKFDHAYIVSWDSDITPSIYSIRNLIKRWELQHKLFSSILIPWTKWQKIRKLCDFDYQITAQHMEQSMLPNTIKINNNRTIQMPIEWE